MLPALHPDLRSRVRRIHLRTHKLVNTALAGAYRSTFRGTGIEFEEVRPYVPGDDVRAIDWNVTARTGEPYVKTYREERELTVHLLVDAGLSMDFGTRRWTKRDAAAQLAGLLALVALRNQDRVGLTVFGSDLRLFLAPSKGSHHVLRLVREVLTAAPSTLPTDLAGALESTQRMLRRRAMVFLVSDFLTVSEPEDGGAASNGNGKPRRSWGELLARLARRHDVIAARVVDRLEEDLPPVGPLVVSETLGRRAHEVDGRSRGVRAAWSAAAAARRERIHRALARARVDRVDLFTDQNLADPLIELFRRRELARRRA